jgi:hypothetical protein
MNEAVIDPSIMEQVSDSIEPPSDSEHVESLDENPDPETCTVVPAEAETGFNVIVSPLLVTVKVADSESAAGLPVAVTVKELDATLATTKEPVNVPSETEQV